ncbi:MAG TPA: alpha/beta hydrolase [Actinomycetota bacterium]|nr:alpha/beta hydrolase [Actinomycetota bacterium]
MTAGRSGTVKTVDIDGPINYVDFGGDGPEMILVHGLGGSVQNWFAVAPGLAENYRVTAVDLVGFGRTPRPEGRSAKVRDNRLVLDRFVDEVAGGSSILVGNSMGGAISILEAAQEPDKVAALVLVDPAVPYPAGQEADPVVAMTFGTYMMDNAEELVTAYLTQVGPEAAVRTTMELCCVDADRVPAEVLDAQIELMKERSEMEWANGSMVEAARSLLELNANEDDFFAAVKAITAPTLLVHGDSDRLIPLTAAQQLANIRPDWRFEVFADTGHVPQLETPERFLSVVGGWLETVLTKETVG